MQESTPQQATGHPQERLRRHREETFAKFMQHWQDCDDRQRRTWLAWIVGRLEIADVEAILLRLEKRLTKKGAKQ